MKRIVIFSALLWITFTLFGQSAESYNCRLGFTFEVSQQQSWGHNKPVVLTVSPLSPASEAGLKVNDIIEEINGVKTSGKSVEEDNNIIRNANEEIILTINNSSGRKEISINKDCKLSTAIDESQLAEVYSFYSLEDITLRTFTCPFKTEVNDEIDLISYKSFGFSEIDQNNQQLENIIYQQIKNCLEEKGLVYDEKNPDLLVNTYYSYNKNLNYARSANADKFPVESRYNVQTNKMETLPIYFNPLINPRQAEFLLNLGVRLIDRKKSAPNNLFVVWECSANELLQSNYNLESYAKIHIPLMFMQFPYPKSSDVAQFLYKKMKYNYTGLSYNIDNLKEIADVDRSSPAYNSRLMPGDVVEKINDIKTTGDPDVASNAYKQFIYQTMPLRDPKTQYTNAEGFTKCMLWDTFRYPQVSQAIQNPEFHTGFSYLYYFQPYINNMSGSTTLTFEVKRNNDKMDIKVTPITRVEESFETY